MGALKERTAPSSEKTRSPGPIRHGTLGDIFLGLLVGNLLAVLSWRCVCAPIATRARLTLYRQLEFIAGDRLVKLYNLANGVLFCFLAGAMVTVSASAVGIPFALEMPAFDAIYPNSLSFVLIVLLVGAVITLVAALGYSAVSRFANIASPWMILVFLACGVVALKRLEVSSFAELEAVWTQSIAFAQGGEVASTMSFLEIMLFAWFCNAAMHIGMSDLSVLRYARKPSAGWATAGGMYVGHFMAWLIPVGLSLYLIVSTGATTWYFPLPAWLVCGALFLVFSRLRGHVPAGKEAAG